MTMLNIAPLWDRHPEIVVSDPPRLFFKGRFVCKMISMKKNMKICCILGSKEIADGGCNWLTKMADPPFFI
jgi:hypothetical protein